MNPTFLLSLSFQVAKAIPKIVGDAHAKVVAAKDPNGPDGAKIDAAELAGIVATVAADVAELILPQLAGKLGVQLA